MKAPSLSKLSSSATSSRQEKTIPPLKNNESHVGGNNAVENVILVDNVNILGERIEIDTIPSSP